ncbi:MAG: 2-C-methyl-D-erythritol 4-phosphate cytidylyltransferase [Desulfobacteraceae bacterium]
MTPDSLKTAAVIPAAGAGIRMKRHRAKQFLTLQDRPILAVTLQAFEDCPDVDGVIVVAPAGDVAYCTEEIVAPFRFRKVRKVVAGGDRRQDSVRLGIEATAGQYGRIVIHDGVRPLITPELLRRVIDALSAYRAVIAALPARETVKEINPLGEVVRTYERDRVWMAQTPQAFRYEDILQAHQRALDRGWQEATDDAFLAERCGIPVKVVEGLERNIKITTPFDLEMARLLMNPPPPSEWT